VAPEQHGLVLDQVDGLVHTGSSREPVIFHTLEMYCT
jgi:hypothetical protein